LEEETPPEGYTSTSPDLEEVWTPVVEEDKVGADDEEEAEEKTGFQEIPQTSPPEDEGGG
jgi:hypothetical protein